MRAVDRRGQNFLQLQNLNNRKVVSSFQIPKWEATEIKMEHHLDGYLVAVSCPYHKLIYLIKIDTIRQEMRFVTKLFLSQSVQQIIIPFGAKSLWALCSSKRSFLLISIQKKFAVKKFPDPKIEANSEFIFTPFQIIYLSYFKTAIMAGSVLGCRKDNNSVNFSLVLAKLQPQRKNLIEYFRHKMDFVWASLDIRLDEPNSILTILVGESSKVLFLKITKTEDDIQLKLILSLQLDQLALPNSSSLGYVIDAYYYARNDWVFIRYGKQVIVIQNNHKPKGEKPKYVGLHIGDGQCLFGRWYLDGDCLWIPIIRRMIKLRIQKLA